MTAADKIREEMERLDIEPGEFREGQVETDIPAEWDRNYESRSVARKLSDGTWVGWTYWYGGGKHGDAGSIPWLKDAYFLTVTEKKKTVIVRKFKKVVPTTTEG